MPGPDQAKESANRPRGPAAAPSSSSPIVDSAGHLLDTISDPGEEGGVDAPNEGDDQLDDRR
ncbi:MAG TPA: hypothetical protein VGS61_05010 [Acidimicrobiales bacterium]|nr:hypothetical protein [Acidimicrobiales bacterium]